MSVVLHHPDDATPAMPQAVIEAAIGGQPQPADTGWLALQSPAQDWLTGGGEWAAAITVGTRATGQRIFYTNVDPSLSWGEQVVVFWGVTFGVLAVVFLLLRRYGQGKGDRSGGTATGLWLLSLPTLAAAAAYLLRLRYKESDLILDYLDPGIYGGYLLIIPAVLLAATAFFIVAPRRRALPGMTDRLARSSMLPFLRGLISDERLPLFLTVACIGLAVFLRLHHIGIETLQADETVSLDAAHGILRTGLPYEVSGVIYTRSFLYHYMLAGWIAVFGDSAAVARAMSVVPGAAVVFVVYRLATVVTGSRWLGLLCALLIAIDPWQIQQSRNIRFYQQMQFCGALATLFFLHGFIIGRDKPSQNWFFVFASLGVVCQEVFVLLFPGYCIAAFVFYRPFTLRGDINVIVGFVMLMTVMLLDAMTFTLVCLTRNVGVSTSVASIIQLHLFNPSAFLNTFFLLERRANLLFGLIFWAAIPFWLRRRNNAVLALYILVLVSVMTATVLVMQIASRYVFMLYPLLMVGVVASLAEVIRFAAARLSAPLTGNPRLLARAWSGFAWTIVLAFLGLNVPLAALARSYSYNLIMEYERAYRYILAHRQPGDIVITVSPMAGAIVLNGVDYYLQSRVGFDEVYMTAPAVVDRWSGGRLISKPDLLRDALLRSKRAWIILDQAEDRKFDVDFLTYIQDTSTVQFTSLGVDLRLWDSGVPKWEFYPNTGGAIDNY